MKPAVQKRTLETRARLLAAAAALRDRKGYGDLRVEEVAIASGVAKGTFFAHFPDKGVLLDHLIGAEMNAALDAMEADGAPREVAALVAATRPLTRIVGRDRFVFDTIVQHSGATTRDAIGPIAEAFHRHADILEAWLTAGDFRRDVEVRLLAHGVQAFLIHSIGLSFCALHEGDDLDDRFATLVGAWLRPGSA